MPKYITKREAERKRAWYRIFAGMMDFFGSIASFIAILVCVAVLTTMLAWFRADIVQTLGLIGESVQSALVRPDD